MALKNNTSSSAYIRFKEGKFYRSNDKEQTFTEIEGEITGLSIQEDEYEGKPLRKLIVKMTDGLENFIISLSWDSVYASDLVGFLKSEKLDLSKTLSLVGVSKKGEDDKPKVGILVKQNDEFMKKYYTKDNPKGLPPMKQVTVNKKKTWEKSEMMDFLEDVLLNDLAKKVSKTKPATGQSGTMVTSESNSVSVSDDSMPF